MVSHFLSRDGANYTDPTPDNPYANQHTNANANTNINVNVNTYQHAGAANGCANP